MINCIVFNSFLKTGSTRPFITIDESDVRCVIKAHGKTLRVKSILNEYIADTLANEIGLSWPQTSLVKLSSDIINQVKKNDLNVLSKIAVGNKYIPNLRPATVL